MDCMTAIAALCGAPEAAIAEGACSAVLSSGSLEHMVAVRPLAPFCPRCPSLSIQTTELH